jgi:hypothetical protein
MILLRSFIIYQSYFSVRIGARNDTTTLALSWFHIVRFRDESHVSICSALANALAAKTFILA